MKLFEKLKALWFAICAMDEPEAEFIGNIQRVVFNTGDVIVVTTDRLLSREHCVRICDSLQPVFPGSRVVVLDSGLKFGVVSMPPVAEVVRGAP